MNKYQCGYCGQPTDENGNPFQVKNKKPETNSTPILTHGTCCVEHVNKFKTISHDMAIDAGDVSLRGQQWVL